jgi:branched-chain amino acid aminotransferase
LKNETIDYITASEAPGPICVKLLKTLKGIQAGTVPDTFGWLDEVKPPTDFVTKDAANGGSPNGRNQSVDRLA